MTVGLKLLHSMGYPVVKPCDHMVISFNASPACDRYCG